MEQARKLHQLMRVAKAAPLRGDSFDSFYVNTDDARGSNTAGKLSDYFLMNIDDPQKVLFMGHRGSGKSTELYRVEQYLKDEFRVVNFSILEEADITDLEYVDVLFIILSKLYEAAVKDEIEVDERVLENLSSYWNNERLEEELSIEKAEINGEAGIKTGLWGVFHSRLAGIFKTGSESKVTVRRYVEPKVSRLLQDANDFIADISDKYAQQDKVLLLIIEDLDKLDVEKAEDIFLNHSKQLTYFNLHIIFTFPIFLHYSGKFKIIADSYNHTEMLSMIKVNNLDRTPHPKGRKIIKELIQRRLDLSLLDDDALDLIVEKSGGSIRHVLKMILDATLEERSRNREATSLSRDSAYRAYVGIRSDFERYIERKHLETLKNLYDKADGKPLQEPNLQEMLQCLAVIEYNCDRWCGLHPAVEDYLRYKKEIS